MKLVCWLQVQQALQGIDQTFGGVPGKVAEIVRKGADKVATESQKAFLNTGQAIAEGNFSRAVNVTQYAAQEIQSIFNETLVQVQVCNFNALILSTFSLKWRTMGMLPPGTDMCDTVFKRVPFRGNGLCVNCSTRSNPPQDCWLHASWQVSTNVSLGLPALNGSASIAFSTNPLTALTAELAAGQGDLVSLHVCLPSFLTLPLSIRGFKEGLP